MEKQLGALNEQGYFSTGFGFHEATEEEKEKLKDHKEQDSEKSK